jgi:sugar O-acyltransferase (sialic acid O-acetyltransferase NeuD family)
MIKELYEDTAVIVGLFDNTVIDLPFPSEANLYSTKAELGELVLNSSHYVVCIGGEYGYARYMTAQKLEECGLRALPIVSKYSILDDVESVGIGIQAMPGATIHKFARIGEHCILNTNCTVDHECIIGDGVHIMGSAAIAGRVNIGNYSTIGTNATVLPDITIGKHVYVGAGAVVTKDIEDGIVVSGVPAREINKTHPTVDLSAFE